ncbi:hypothetical protein PU629_21545 [Pullulanibacillus sp. KACC 23026]|uniref:hypothetical protein n=1 Tax=Pullulanibacillus sp. KACC 23026 TaxID=3028315 RepID=UPI0023AFD3A6|nr:hypothetical protein [Pullulanibacillus sp. KACC 23026]WEG12630.1 hypothetical protein PU629_21545 [Pullulanibacillus sp. KACC 23026]
MTNIQRRLINKIKKQILVLLLIPIALGLIGYMLPGSKVPTTYTAEATLTLGNYGDTDLNDAKSVSTLLMTAPFYIENLPDLWAQKEAKLENDLKVVTSPNSQLLTVTYTDASKTDAVKILNQITNAFMSLDKKNYDQRVSLIQDSISAVQKKSVASDAIVDQQRFLYDQKMSLLNMKPAVLLKVPDSEANSVDQSLSSKERGVLGVLLGIAFGFIWIVVPELVRKQ